MTAPLPLLPTMGVGSAASPGWFVAGQRQAREGNFGAGDIAELYEDATRIAIADQIEAGLDVVSDGELHRQRFVFEMFGHLAGLKRVAPQRRLGVPGSGDGVFLFGIRHPPGSPATGLTFGPEGRQR